MLEKLTHHDFLPYLNQTFLIHYDGTEQLEVRLVKVEVVGKPYKANHREPFSVRFISPLKDRYLVQGTYSVEHEKLGTFAIFITALGSMDEGMGYEAIFT